MSETSVQEVLGLFDRSAWIITASSGGKTGGLVATFVNNASIVPALPRLVVGIAQHHYTWELIRASRSFAAHLVDERHAELIWRFGLRSGRRVDKFDDLKWRKGETGSPLLEDALAWVDCAVEAELDIGDRTIYVAAILDGGVMRAGVPVTARRLHQLAPAHQRDRMEEQRRRDQALDTAAVLAWRANRQARQRGDLE